MAEEGGGSLLIVLMETHAAAWAAAGAADPATGDPGLDPATLVSHLGAFVGAHEMDDPANTAAVLGVHGGQCPVLYLSPGMRDYDDAGEGSPDEPSSSVTTTVAASIAGGIAALVAADEARSTRPSPSPPPSLAAGLARAVCLAARHCPRAPAADGEDGGLGAALVVADGGDGVGGLGGSGAGVATAAPDASASLSKAARPRILVLAATPGASDAYVPMMNAVFAAQRLGVPIDAAAVGPAGAGVLQQAAHLSGGLYLRVRPRAGLAQALVTAVLPHPRLRPFLSAPATEGVDLRASCFCHWRPVDVGHVCSVCLSIFCEARGVCDTCGAVFLQQQAGGQGAGDKRAASGGGEEAEEARAGQRAKGAAA